MMTEEQQQREIDNSRKLGRLAEALEDIRRTNRLTMHALAVLVLLLAALVAVQVWGLLTAV